MSSLSAGGRASVLSPYGLTLAVATTFVMAAGDGLAGVALAIRIYGTSHAGWAVALVFLATSLPVVVLAPLAGFVLDHLPLRMALVAGACWIALFALALSFIPSLALTLTLAFGFGVGAAVVEPGMASLVPRLVDGPRLTRANGYVQAATWTGVTVGPVLAGTLSAVGGAHLALRVDALAYAIGAAVLAVLPLRHTGPAVAEVAESFWTKITAGLRFLRSQPELLVVVLIVAAMIGFVNLATVAEVAFAESVLGAGPRGYAALVASWTGAMVVGTLLAGRLPARSLLAASLLATIGTGVGVGVAGLTGSLWQAIAAYAFGGLVNGIEVVATRSLLSHRAPAGLVGRVFALNTGLAFAASGIGTAAAGVLLVPFGARVVLLLAGGGAVVAGVLGSASQARRRWRERAAA